MLLRRYVAAISRKKCCRSYSLCGYLGILSVVYLCWQISHITSPEDYILQDKRHHLFVLPPGDTWPALSEVFVVSAFYDNREINVIGNVLRILALTTDRTPSLHCCVQSPSTLKWICSTTMVHNKIIARNSYGASKSQQKVFEVIYTCKGFPDSVFRERPDRGILVDPSKGQYTKETVQAEFSITYRPSDINPHPVNRSLTVCVIPSNRRQAAQFSDKQDVSEFSVLAQLLGASQMLSYYSNVLVNNVLKRSATKGMKFSSITWKTPYGDQDKFQTLAMNDCLYRSSGHNTYSVFLDVNEVLVPSATTEWLSLVNTLYKIHNSTSVGAYNFQVFAFYDETTNRTAKLVRTGKVKGQLPYSTRPHLPRSVRYRLSENTSISEMTVIQPEKVDHMSFTGRAKMLPGFSVINVPQEFGTVHRFV